MIIASHRFRLAIAAILLQVLSSPAHAETLSGQARVVDGDTFIISSQRIRLNGIDAPETKQSCTRDGRRWACGKAATRAMRKLIGSNQVRCEVSGRDRYDRVIAACYAGSRDLQQQLVRQGLALAYRKYSTRYVPDEDAARAEGIGVWSGKFTEPWRWRREKRGKNRDRARSTDRGRSPSTSAPTAGTCLIKGNISQSGHIYHVPGAENYDRTRINESRGERWFCSEADARAAGWRRAGR